MKIYGINKPHIRKWGDGWKCFKYNSKLGRNEFKVASDIRLAYMALMTPWRIKPVADVLNGKQQVYIN